MKLIGIPIKSIRLKGSKLETVTKYRDASAAIRAKKSKRVRVAKRMPT